MVYCRPASAPPAGGISAPPTAVAPSPSDSAAPRPPANNVKEKEGTGAQVMGEGTGDGETVGGSGNSQDNNRPDTGLPDKEDVEDQQELQNSNPEVSESGVANQGDGTGNGAEEASAEPEIAPPDKDGAGRDFSGPATRGAAHMALHAADKQSMLHARHSWPAPLVEIKNKIL
jgi:hypothetical protein